MGFVFSCPYSPSVSSVNSVVNPFFSQVGTDNWSLTALVVLAAERLGFRLDDMLD
jgi:hypothetical protein